jgi:uncharacterized protein YbbC (DUF1343 family)
VTTGSTRLAYDNFERLAGLNIGFIGNHTSRLANGKSTISSIIQSGVCKVVKVFSPEHGAYGQYDDMVEDEIDRESGLSIFSLYGEHKKPTQEMLHGLDMLVFEIQDVGARFYTYTATLLLAIDAAFDNGLKLLVLDRPNPISGLRADGPVVGERNYSFVAPYSIPIQHGLTLGELALVYATETRKASAVNVEGMLGWRRGQYFDDTGIEWVNPSPAMTSLSSALIYPGTCLLEQTNISVGRGTDSPFELIGAPFINGGALRDALLGCKIDGLQVTEANFIPKTSKFAGEDCGGIRVRVVDRNAFRAVPFGMLLLRVLQEIYGANFDVEGAQTLLASPDTFSQLISGKELEAIEESWLTGLEIWHNRCKNHLLYAK